MIVTRIPLSGPKFDPASDMSFDGTYTVEEKIMDGSKYWLLIFTESGSITVNKEVKCDICICGGGAGGTDGSASSYASGFGGSGGFVNNYYEQTLVSGDIIIGAGGARNASGGASSYGSFTANGGITCSGAQAGTKYGGSGGGVPWTCAVLEGQGTTTRPFGSSEMDPLGAGGGAGTYLDGEGYYNGAFDQGTTNYVFTGGAGGTDGGNGSAGTRSTNSATSGTTTGGAGGYKGGGNGGGINYASSALNPTAGSYYGAGGGGGAGFKFTNTNFGSSTTNNTNGASGHKGVVMIRIPK